MTRGTQRWCSVRTWGMGCGGSWEGVQDGAWGAGTHAYLWPILVDVWQHHHNIAK